MLSKLVPRAVFWSLLLAFVTSFFCIGAEPGAAESSGKALDSQIRASLPKVINTGADLFNEGDRAGCAFGLADAFIGRGRWSGSARGGRSPSNAWISRSQAMICSR